MNDSHSLLNMKLVKNGDAKKRKIKGASSISDAETTDIQRCFKKRQLEGNH
jgi:hypothetical protein